MATFGTVLEVVTVIVSVACFFVTVSGAAKTQAILRRGDQRDLVIDVLAWLDRKLLRATGQ